MNILSLNPQQKEAVLHNDGPLMILAGAGSGKTRVITQKIAYLIQEKKVSPLNILGVTFTNKAAHEMKDRLMKTLGKGQLRGIILSTFHSLCVRILRADGLLINYQPRFSIYGTGDQIALVKQILLDSNVSLDEVDPDHILSLISKAKNQLLLPEHLADTMAGDNFNQLFLNVYKAYQKRLFTHQAMDFDDLLLHTALLLSSHEEMRRKYQKRFRYILVDEYQDSNYAQFQLIKLLSKRPSNITVVGDDDQSIYSWRGAESNNFQQFQQEFAPVHTIILDQNYRSTSIILESAGAVINENTNRIPKNLWSDKGRGEPITYYECVDENEEADKVANLLFAKKFKARKPYHDFAILYRTNFQSRPFETALRERNISYRVVGGVSFYDRKEIRDLVAYLKLINNLDDDVSLLRIVNYPKRGIGEVSVEAIRRHAADHSLTLFQAMEDFHHLDSLDQKARTRVMEFVEIIHQFKEEFEENRLSPTMTRLIDHLDYNSAIYTLCKDDKEWQRKLDNIKNFIKTIESYENRENEDNDEDSNPSLGGFLMGITLSSDIPKSGDDKIVEDKVTLLTLHSAKGLEFPHVYLVGMEEGILPHGNNENIEEERRLCYVGFTRAMTTLTLTSCQTRKKYGRPEQQTPSRFLEAIPSDLMDIKALGHEEELDDQDADAYFSNLKGLLAD